MKPPAPDKIPPNAVLKVKVGPNWKLIRNLFIIAGLLFAISIAWENLHRTRAQRDLEIRQAKAEQEEAREKAIADAKKRAAELANRAKPEVSLSPPAVITPKPPQRSTPTESLERLRPALASGDLTEMPPGTRQRGSCAYLFVTEPMTWPEAAAFAERHGGLLAIPNADANLMWLLDNAAEREAIWIGAFRNETGNWMLADGKYWSPAAEPDGTGTYLSVDNRGLLVTLDADARLPFVIQWGHQSESQPAPKPGETVSTPEETAPSPEETAPSPEEIELTSRARKLIVAAELKCAEQLAENTRTMTWDLDAWLRTLPKSEQTVWLPHITRLKESCENGRVPSSIPESSGIDLSEKMAEIARFAAEKQSRIERMFLIEAGKIHRAYLAKIKDAATQAGTAGNPTLARSLGITLDEANDLDSWLRSLGVDSAPNSSDP